MPTLDCICSAISDTHRKAAEQILPLPQTADELYVRAHKIKHADPNARVTGRQPTDSFKCGRCREIFEGAVAALAPQVPAMPISIVRMIAATTDEPRIGQCGRDCNTCTPKVVEAAGCQPAAL